jgi:hypothetical protein
MLCVVWLNALRDAPPGRPTTAAIIKAARQKALAAKAGPPPKPPEPGEPTSPIGEEPKQPVTSPKHTSPIGEAQKQPVTSKQPKPKPTAPKPSVADLDETHMTVRINSAANLAADLLTLDDAALLAETCALLIESDALQAYFAQQAKAKAAPVKPAAEPAKQPNQHATTTDYAALKAKIADYVAEHPEASIRARQEITCSPENLLLVARLGFR